VEEAAALSVDKSTEFSVEEAKALRVKEASV
jgi:hypothetical protein